MNSSLQPDILETSRWYEDKVRRFGFDHRGLGFRSRSSQERRFEALIALGNFHGRRVLDVGCGFGDLLDFLAERNIRPLYTGLDVCEPMIERCRERFPAGAGRFVVGDVLDHQPAEPYDYVVASGIFGLEADGARERIRPTVMRMYEWARIGMAANFLSRCAPDRAEARVYMEPAEVLELGLSLTPAARLDHTYLPNDFTLHLHKSPPWVGTPARTP